MSDDQSSKESKPLFEIRFRSGGVFAPRTIEEIERWCSREREAWKRLEGGRKSDPQLDYILNLQTQYAKQIAQQLQAVNQDAAGGTDLQPRIEQIRQHLKERYEKHGALVSDEPAAKFVADVAARNPEIAAHTLWSLLDKPPQGASRPALQQRGQVLAAIFSLGYAELPKWHESAWAEVRAKVSDEHEELRQSAEGLQNAFALINQEIAESKAAQVKEFVADQDERNTSYADLVNGHQEEMENIRKAFKHETALKSAVMYLQNKGASHRKLAWRFAISAIVVGGAAISGALYLGFAVLAGKSRVDFDLPQLAAAAFVVTLAFWLLRVLVRSLLSNMHLSQDMGARAVLVQTYVALIAEGGAIEAEDREKVIALVFRPTSDGLVRDDAAPPGWLSFLTGNR